MTALVIIVTGSYLDPQNQEFIAKNQGGALTSAAMGSVISVSLFAFLCCFLRIFNYDLMVILWRKMLGLAIWG